MEENEYKCELCKGIYKKGWTDEEANAESKEMWGVDNASESKEMATICDDCFKEVTNIDPIDNAKDLRRQDFLRDLKRESFWERIKTAVFLLFLLYTSIFFLEVLTALIN